jgi:hypothetical protein
MKKLLLFLLLVSCIKDTYEQWICYKTVYIPPCTKCGDAFSISIEDSFNIDADRRTIAIFMSQNNFRDSTGFGYSWECKLR